MLSRAKIWYNQLTKGEDKRYSLSDTQFFWITVSWLVLLPAVIYATFYIGKATWKELAVYCLLEVAVLAFKYAKFIKIKYQGTEVNLSQKEESGEKSSL